MSKGVSIFQYLDKTHLFGMVDLEIKVITHIITTTLINKV
jgi:hypothetical protein